MDRFPRRLGGFALQGAPAVPSSAWTPPPPESLQTFEVTFGCSGRTFIAVVKSRNSQFAVHDAEIELASKCPDFDHDDARVLSCRQVL